MWVGNVSNSKSDLQGHSCSFVLADYSDVVVLCSDVNCLRVDDSSVDVDTIWYGRFTCAQMLTDGQLNLAHGPETKNNEKNKNQKPRSLLTVSSHLVSLSSSLNPPSGLFTAHLVDVLATSSPALVTDVKVSDADFLSDHRLVCATVATHAVKPVVVGASRNIRSIDTASCSSTALYASLSCSQSQRPRSTRKLQPTNDCWHQKTRVDGVVRW